MSVIATKHFRWLPTRSAWQELEYHRQRRAESLKDEQAVMDEVNVAMTNALQNKITTSANNAAQAALKRVQAAVKAKSDANIKQIDNTQKLVDQSQTAADTADTADASSVNTTA